MTTDVGVRLSIADALGRLMKDGLPFRFEAFDGSTAGPEDAPIKLRLLNERGLSYLMTAPGDLGFARAYVSGDLELEGVHPGNPYDAMVLIMSQLKFKVPSAPEMLADRPQPWLRQPQAPAAARGGAPAQVAPRDRGHCATTRSVTPRRSTTTTTSPTASTSSCSARR